MEMMQTVIAWASVVNAISVLVLVAVTAFYGRETSKSRKAAERVAQTSVETVRMLRLQIEEQAGLGRTIRRPCKAPCEPLSTGNKRATFTT